MYISKVNIENIKAIESFEMTFDVQPGWHVLIGDNGSGKSSIIKSIALVLIGREQVLGLRPDWYTWLQKGKFDGLIKLETILNKNATDIIEREAKFDVEKGVVQIHYKNLNNGVEFIMPPDEHFSAGFGPFRRFTGGSKEYEGIFKNTSLTTLACHLSLFGEDVALTEATEWLIKLQYQTLEKISSGDSIAHMKSLINSPEFLPHGAQLTKISSEGVLFKDGNGKEVSVNQMSDGFRSILSLTFELIRQLVRIFGEQEVFKNIATGNMYIDLPGVVLIDEVDAHLHPTWQTRIGQWFLQYFPKMQFIVTSHSPLVCRACEKGSIWRLAAPGSDRPSGQVTGTERDRLIFGNVLDAYGTDVFGENVSISKEANEKLNEMAELNIKSLMGEISGAEEEKLQELKTILPTENKMNMPKE